MSEQDTREKLEADVRQYANPGDYKNTLGSYWEKKILSFLDRQASITEREVKERVDFSLITQTANALFPDYQEQIAELTAERDELQAAIDAMGNGQMYAMYRQACAERDALCERLEAITAALHDKPGT